MKAYRTLLFVLVLSMSFALPLRAQFSDSVHYYVRYASTGSINKTDAATAYLLNNNGRFSVRKDRVSMNLNAGWVYGQQNKLLTNNDVNTSLDVNVYATRSRHFYVWGLGNYTSSYSLKINNQYQTGAGLAYSILDRPGMYLNLSDGLLYEGSSIQQPDSTNEVYNTFRNSFRLVFNFTIWKMVTFNGSGFAQHSLQYNDDYILRGTAGLSFKLNSWLSLTSNVIFNKVSRTEKQNLLFTYGLTAEKYF